MGRNSSFTEEEKCAAVQLVTEGGRTISSVANEYGIHENTLFKWKRQFKYRQEAENSENRSKTETPEEAAKELTRMQRRIKELEAENEFLKKVSAYFAKSPR